MGGKPAYISYISPTQINALAPNLGPGIVSVTVTDSIGASTAAMTTAPVVQPAFFQWSNYATATRQDYSLAVKNGALSGLTTVAAKPGEIIILWGNRLHQVAIQIPASLLDGDYPVVATVSGAQSLPATLITVQK